MQHQFTKNVDELVAEFKTQKVNLTSFVKKNFKQNIHFIQTPISYEITRKGGQNCIHMWLTAEAFDLVKNTYNLKNRYIKKINDNSGQVNMVMAIEAQTIGFIENAFSSALKLKRQKRIGKYYIDLYFEDYNLAIECDENDHVDRDQDNERTREDFLIKQNITIVRYNPNHKHFDLSDVIREITHLLFCKPSVPSVIRVEF
jgi:very-short-patch-repair endonuclease